MLSKEERDRLKENIITQMESIKSSIASLEEGAKPVPPDDSIGRLTRMEAISSQGISEANLRSSRSRLSRLEIALSRIDDPEFGICVECEEPIPIGRLKLMPEATRCVHCAES